MVGHSGYPGVHLGAAQGLRVDLFSSGRPYQRRPAEKDGSLLPHHDHLVAHGRNVRAPGGAGPHDHRHLGNAQGRHLGLVVEDSSEVVPVGEHLRLQWQEGSPGIH